MKIEKKGYSLAGALMCSFMLCIAILLLFVFITLVPSLSRMLEDNAIERTKETVLQGVETAEIFVDNMLSTLYYTTTLLPETMDNPTPNWHQQLLLMKQSNPAISAMAFFRDDGSLFYSTAGKLSQPKELVTKEAWFTKALQWGGTVTYFSKPHVQKLFTEQSAYVITLARSVYFMENGVQNQGVLRMDIDYSTFNRLIDNITLSQSGYVFVIDHENELITHPKLQMIYHGLASENLDAIDECLIGQGHDNVDNRERVLIIATLNQTRWRLVGVAYMDEVLAVQRTSINIISVVIICAMLLSFSIASIMAYWIMRPIKRLEEGINEVQQGSLHPHIPSTGFEEIRSLSTAFEQMLERIRALMDQIVLEQETKRLYELNALQAQINPHFLYNTLDSIIWMEERGKSKEAIKMVSALAKLFRISISKGCSMITVREELEHVRNYLIIQKMRFKDKFSYKIEADPEALNERTVKLIVQPLVENAINHAIDETEETPMFISIKAKLTETELLFIIEDDGIGMDEDLLKNLLITEAGKSGIGVKNVHERIQLTYGAIYGLKIDSEEDEGTTVTIRIPRMAENDSKGGLLS